MSVFEKEIMDKLKYRPETPQKKAILETKNTVVSAGAGSGKTMVLSMRFLRLVVDGLAKPDKILALTFTNKAANEMKSRIYKNLMEYKEFLPKGSIETFPDSMITTLDSFSNYITKMGCQDWGISKDYTIDDDLCEEIVIKVAKNFISQNENMMEGLSVLSEIYPPDELISLVLVGIGKNSFTVVDNRTASEMEIILLNDIRKMLDNQINLFEESIEAIIDISAKYDSIKNNAKKAVEWAKSIFQKLEQSNTNKVELINSIEEIKPLKKGQSEVNNELITPVDQSLDSLSIIKIAVFALKEKNIVKLRHILEFFEVFRDSVTKEKRKKGILTFQDVSALAIEIVKENSEIREMLKNRFKFVMIDEFQDNNINQKDLLYMICEKHVVKGKGIPSPDDIDTDKLFFVGDEKQSIYKFRNADVSVFKNLSGELINNGGNSIELERNFRSEPFLISFFNNIFSKVMHSENRAPYEAEFRSLKSRESIPALDPKLKFLYYFNDKEEKENLAGEVANGFLCEAFGIGNMIASILGLEEKKQPEIINKTFKPEDFIVSTNGENRIPRPQDIAVLYKNSTHQGELEKALKYYGIPYSILDDKNMMMESIVNDIYSFLQLLVYPKDRLAYAAVLRSPICNLDDIDIINILENAKEKKCFEEIESDSLLTEEGNNKYKIVQKLYLKMIELSGNSTIEKLINTIWYDYGLRLYYVNNFNFQSKMGNFDFFIETARVSDNKGESIVTYLDKIRDRIADNKKQEFKVLSEEEDTVKLMTIHKSKGLEFPIVFVCNTTSRPHLTNNQYINYKGIPIVQWLNIDEKNINLFEKEAIKEESNKDLAELKRIMYVAFTRAETHLIISGAFNKTNISAEDDEHRNTMALQFLNASGLFFYKDDEEINLIGKEDKNNPIDIIKINAFSLSDINKRSSNFSSLTYDIYKTIYNPLEFKNNLLGVTEYIKPFNFVGKMKQLQTFPSDQVLKFIETENYSPYSEFGTFVHSLVESFIRGEEKKNIYEILGESSTLLESLNVDQIAILESDGEKMANNFMTSDFHKNIVENSQTKIEVGFFSKIEDKVLEGFIDLLVKKNDKYYVVDFKTDSLLFTEKHKQQVEIYVDAIKKIYKTENVEGYLFYLRSKDGSVKIV